MDADGGGRRDGDGRPDLGAEYRSAVEAARSTFEAFLRRRPPTSAAAGDTLEGDAVDDARPAGATTDAFRFDDLRRTMRRSMDLYLEMAERFLDSSSRSFETALRDRRVGISGAEADAAATAVRLGTAAGEQASSRVWVHNRTDRPIVAARFRATDLWNSRGDVIGAGSVRVDPATVSLAPGESTSSTIVIGVAPGATPAVYYGHVMLEGPHDVAVPLRLDVRPAPAAPS